MKEIIPEEIAEKLAKEIQSSDKPKRMKLKTLLGLFNYKKRSDTIVLKITELLEEQNIILNPSILNIDNNCKLNYEDQVFLLDKTNENHKSMNEETVHYDYKKDSWFDEIVKIKFYSEKEVENKFIIPLLKRLKYEINDRLDDFPIPAKNGGKSIILRTDFVLFDSENIKPDDFVTSYSDKDKSSLQTLLVVEAKKEEKPKKNVELENAKNQVKSYGYWIKCHFGLITDGSTIQVIKIFSSIGENDIIFNCERAKLKENFPLLYKKISKDSLINHYKSHKRIQNKINKTKN